jgi:MFS transporter, UMF1 family
MAWFPKEALRQGVERREVVGWAMYDFANSGYTTVVLTAVYNAYFVSVVAQKADWATLAWTLTLALSNALVMVLMPAIGAYADAHNAKKRLLALATVGCVTSTLALALTREDTLAVAITAIVVSNFFFAMGECLVAAFLPELAKPDALGRVSGWGWSFGYLGGMLALGLGLGYVMWASGQGQAAQQFVPVTLMITAGVYAAACTLTFLWLRERAPAPRPASSLLAERSLGLWPQLRALLRASSPWVDFKWLLACAVAYQAGIAVVIALAAIYAQEVLGFKQQDTMMLIFLVNIAAALGAFAFGYLQDRIGHKRSLALTLVGWILMTIMAMVATTAATFWVAAVIAGLCMGSSQSAGRAMAGALAPPTRCAEFYGVWTLATRLASIIGPVTYGVVTWITSGNHRLAIASTAVFFVVGLVLLKPFDLARGAEQASKA